MLPLIVSAVRRLLSAASPYGLHELPHSVPLTYLPGTWLPFVPAVGLGLDPRLVEILATLAATALLVWAAPRERRDVAGALLALFLTTPYVQYRHEIYLGPLWLSLALVAFGDARRLSRLGALALGWAVASSQFVWVIVPVYVAQLARREGLRATLRVSASAGVTALLLVGPFLAVAPRPFVDGVFGHWERTLNVTTANLAYGVVQLVSLAGLRLVQAVAWLTASVVALRLSRVGPAPWAAMAAVLGVFVLFNSVVWVYFYLTVFFLMAASAAVGPQAEDAPARPVQEG